MGRTKDFRVFMAKSPDGHELPMTNQELLKDLASRRQNRLQIEYENKLIDQYVNVSACRDPAFVAPPGFPDAPPRPVPQELRLSDHQKATQLEMLRKTGSIPQETKPMKQLPGVHLDPMALIAKQRSYIGVSPGSWPSCPLRC